MLLNPGTFVSVIVFPFRFHIFEFPFLSERSICPWVVLPAGMFICGRKQNTSESIDEFERDTEPVLLINSRFVPSVIAYHVIDLVLIIFVNVVFGKIICVELYIELDLYPVFNDFVEN